MNEANLRAWHRRLGVLISPFLFLQTLSGVLFSLDLYRDVRAALRAPLPPGVEAPVAGLYDTLMRSMHYGSGKLGYAYHVALGSCLLVLILSGLWIWVRRVRR
ncbi:MAG: hypothetical protein AB1578_23050 [Thermodesulfobacteriota bacterium]